MTCYSCIKRKSMFLGKGISCCDFSWDIFI